MHKKQEEWKFLHIGLQQENKYISHLKYFLPNNFRRDNMPIQGIVQPDNLVINEMLRLRKFDGYFNFAYEWYQN